MSDDQTCAEADQSFGTSRVAFGAIGGVDAKPPTGEVSHDNRVAQSTAVGTLGRFGRLHFPPIVGDDEHAIGLERHLVFGGSMKLAVN
jgi:hypothetical protein